MSHTLTPYKPTFVSKQNRMIMTGNYLKYIFLIWVLHNALITYSQKTISSGGNHLTSDSIQLSHTIGESFINNYSDSDIHINEGVQQSIKVIVTQVEQAKTMEISTFPNPASDVLNINVSSIENTKGKFNWRLLDITGKTLLEQQNRDQGLYQISLIDFTPGMYFLKTWNEVDNTTSVHKIKVTGR